METRVPTGEGTIQNYILYNASVVQPDMRQGLQSLPALSAIRQVFLPIGSKIYIHHEETSLPRLREVFRAWQHEDETNRGELFRALTTESPDSDPDNDRGIIRLMSLLFPREELLQGLSSFQSDLAEPNESSLTAIRRTVSALRDNFYILKDYEVIQTEDERAEMIVIMTPFVSSPILSSRVRTEIAEMAVYVTPDSGHDHEVPLEFWWRALDSYTGGVPSRAIGRLATIIDNHNIEQISEIERLVDGTEVSAENYVLWNNFSKAVESLSLIPEKYTDGIFKILMKKVVALEKQPKALNTFSLSDVCKTMNTLLYYAYYRRRTAELMDESETLLFVERLLDLYIPLKNDVNIRGPILNLLFMILIRTHPNMPLGRHILTKIATAVDNLHLFQGPPEEVPLDLLGELFRSKFGREQKSELFGV